MPCFTPLCPRFRGVLGPASGRFAGGMGRGKFTATLTRGFKSRSARAMNRERAIFRPDRGFSGQPIRRNVCEDAERDFHAMTEPTELDQAFQSTMAQATAAKAELIETMHRPVDAPTMLLIFEGLRAVRKTRRVAITKYRELKPLDT